MVLGISTSAISGDGYKVGGVYKAECYSVDNNGPIVMRDGKAVQFESVYPDGVTTFDSVWDFVTGESSQRYRFKWEAKTKNLVTNAGLDALNNIMFHGATQIATWYIGLIDDGETLAAADTLASHSGWTENTEYSSPAARGEWTEGASSSQVITNATSVDFTMNDSGTLAGLFLCSVSSGTSGTLFSEAAFTGGDRTYVSTDVIKVTYTLTGADS